jgi:hypothetical protein
MKTDDLIAMLGTNVEPVDHRQVARTVRFAIAIGVAAALGSALLMLGIRTGLDDVGAWIFMGLKLAFATGIVAVGSVYLMRVARPGGEQKAPIIVLALPFIVIMALAATSLVFAPSSHWNRMVVGDQWLECLLSIPIIAIVPFAVIVWAVRQTAPTDLVRAGALAGLAAGGVSAAGYALHCTDDSLPFVALWYGGTIALCTAAGAMLGPRLLRW